MLDLYLQINNINSLHDLQTSMLNKRIAVLSFHKQYLHI